MFPSPDHKVNWSLVMSLLALPWIHGTRKTFIIYNVHGMQLNRHTTPIVPGNGGAHGGWEISIVNATPYQSIK